MSRISALIAAAVLSLPFAANAAEYTIDAVHSSANFSVKHMMVSSVRGRFSGISGTLNYDAKNPSATKVEAKIDATSINTDNQKRDEHLRSPDFFDVAKYPSLEFKSKKVAAASKGKLKITGDLTMHGVTKEVVLDVEGPTSDIKDPWGNTKAGATATTKVNRKDFGLGWNKALETGGVVVGDEVTITLEIELTAVQPAKTAAAQ